MLNKILNSLKKSKEVNTHQIENIKEHFIIDDLKSFVLESKQHKNNIVIININKFMEINIEFGFDTGNILIDLIKEKINTFFEEKFEEEIQIFITNPGEFSLFLKDYQKDNKVLQELINFIEEEPFVIQDNKIYIKIRISVSENKYEDFKNVMFGIKLIKTKHKNIIYSNELNAYKNKIKTNFEIFALIKKALKEDKVIPYFQPVVDKYNNVHHYEILIRIEDDGKLLTPNIFLDIEKEFQIYRKFTEKITKKITNIYKTKELPLSVNIDMEDLENNTFRQCILNNIDNIFTTTDNKENFYIELNINRVIDKNGPVFNFIEKLYNKEVNLILDNFGTGFSNIELLYSLKNFIWGVKYSRELIQDINNNEFKQEILKNLNSVLQKNNIITIAKYVENKEIKDILTTYHINYFQGYYCSAPKALKEED